MIIYKITNLVNGKVYIGQTTKTLDERIAGHRNAFASNVDMHIYRAMHKYGWDNFQFSILDDSATTQVELDALERYYINQYDSIKHGYNMIDGGSNVNPMFYEKSRTKHDKKMRDPETRAKISESMKASYAKRGGPTVEHRKHLSEQKRAMYASEQGEAVRAKFRANFKVSPEHRRALIEGRKKGVYCIDIDEEVVAEFDMIKEAAQWWLENGYKVKDYNQLCDRIKESFVQDKYIKGLKWIYVDQQAGHRA